MKSTISTIAAKSFKAVRQGAAVLLILAATTGVSYAGGSGSTGGSHGSTGGSHGGMGVPEIDPGSMASAVTLCIGGVLMLTDRIRRKN